nr:4Fe-4S binding protein [Lachnospiraceae bacterium]
MRETIHISISELRCKQCGICSALCPKQVFTQEVGKIPVVSHMDACIACRLCEMRCPDFAIDVVITGGEER